MGVKNLWKLLSPCGKRVSLENKTLAIDTSIWLYQYRSLPSHLVIFSFCRRLFRILYSKIKPVFVFDGAAPALKQKTLEERRKLNDKLILKKFLMNSKCEKCGEDSKNCGHATELSPEKLESLNKEAFEKIKNHGYNWGELSDESEIEEYFTHGSKRYFNSKMNAIEDNKTVNDFNSILNESASEDLDNHEYSKFYNDNSIANFDKNKLENLSKVKQLEMLSDLRSKRKLPMYCDTSNFFNFSNCQIENLKKRNQITSLIKNLNKDASRIIQSDCRTEAVFEKTEETSIFRNYVTSDQHKDEKSINVEEKQAEDEDLESLFNLYENDKKPMEKSITEKKRKVSQSFDFIERKINLNTELLKNSKVIKKDSFPLNKKEYPATSQKLRDDLPKEIEESSSIEFSKEDLISDSVEDFNFPSETSSDLFLQENSKTNNEISLEITEIKKLQLLFIEILNIFEIPYIQSIGETDPQCWYLFKNNLIDGVISEDNDMIIYGTTVYKNFFRRDKDILEFSISDVKEKLNLDQNDLIKLCYLLGSDYCSGIKGVGVKRAVEKIKTVQDDDIDFLNKIYKNDDNLSSEENELGVVQVQELVFGSLNKNRLRYFLLNKGLDQPKIEELLLYMQKVNEIYTED